MSHDATGPVKVLLVDDSEAFLEAATSWIGTQPSLRLVGTARDGAEALARLDGAEASLVLMDAFMPVLDGFEATRRIKATAGSPVVILMSVHDAMAVEQEAWAAGADAFLPKSEFSDRLPKVILEIFGEGRRPITASPSLGCTPGSPKPRGAERSQQSTVVLSVLDRVFAVIRRLRRNPRPGPDTHGPATFSSGSISVTPRSGDRRGGGWEIGSKRREAMKHRKGILAGAGLLVALAMPWASARAMTLADTSLVDLLRDSESIVVGQVASISDGIDAQGIPYTEVTLAISESIRGTLSGTYTFRQFGLREPRLSADGTRKMMPAPEGFPRFEGGEQVVLFLNRPASLTGLQTTIGLANGKFKLGAARAENDRGNIGVFSNVSLEAGLATDNDARMLATEGGAVNSDTFLSFVRRAVQDQWIESCRMWNTDEGKPHCRTGVRRPLRQSGSGTTLMPGTTQSGGSQIFGQN